MKPEHPARNTPRRFDRVVTSGPKLELCLDFSPTLLIGRMAGHLRGRTRGYLHQTFRSALGQRPERVVVDATGLVTCDAAGLAALAEALDVSADYQPPLAVSSLSPVYRRMLRVVSTSRSRRILTYCTLTEAVDDLMARPAPQAPEQEDLLQEVRNLHRALLTRDTIEQAKGVLMVVYGLDADAAFAMLKWYSRNANLALHELAARLLAALPDEPSGSLSMVRMDALLADLTYRPPQADGRYA